MLITVLLGFGICQQKQFELLFYHYHYFEQNSDYDGPTRCAFWVTWDGENHF